MLSAVAYIMEKLAFYGKSGGEFGKKYPKSQLGPIFGFSMPKNPITTFA